MGEILALPTPEFTTLWAGYRRGDGQAQEQLLSACYQELRSIARGLLAGDGAAQHFQPTELAHEAALRLLRLRRIDVADQTHFLALSARVMRQVLVDEMRRVRAAKRQVPSALTTWFEPGPETSVVDIERLDRSLTRLASISPVRARIVELRFFAGLQIDEIVDIMGLSASTLKRHWKSARAWLLRDLTRRP